MLFFIYRGEQSRGGTGAAGRNRVRALKRFIITNGLLFFSLHQVEKGRSKEAQLKAAESNEKVYPYQRTFVLLPSSGGKGAEQ